MAAAALAPPPLPLPPLLQRTSGPRAREEQRMCM